MDALDALGLLRAFLPRVALATFLISYAAFPTQTEQLIGDVIAQKAQSVEATLRSALEPALPLPPPGR